MNKSESKYFNTAARMDEAFLALLEKKDFAYITVKELCAAAGVNRSTFYLHYETMADLLAECADYMNQRFFAYMQQDSATFIAKLHTCPLEELYLVTPEYLTPYLRYIRDNSGYSARGWKTPPRCGWIKATRDCCAMWSRRFWSATAFRRQSAPILWRSISAA